MPQWNLAGISLRSPFIASSGCAAYGTELVDLIGHDALGAIITKSIALEPRDGRPTPRTVETRAGMLNAIGLQGCGIDHFLAHELPRVHATGVTVGVSITGKSATDFARLAEQIADTGMAAFLELNISCPNTDAGDVHFSATAHGASSVVRAVVDRVHHRVPVLVKLSADVTDLPGIARACVDAGASGLSLINTLTGAAMNMRTLTPALSGMTGGLSGPAIHPIALRAIWQIRATLPDIPILGGGGVTTGEDAAALLAAGANALSIGTALLHDPHACARIAAELDDFATQHHLHPSQLTSIAHKEMSSK